MNLKELEERIETAEKNGLLKINIVHEEDGNEGIWACFASRKDANVYEKDSFDEEIECFLMNHALVGHPTWGARVTVKTNGEQRPVIKVNDLIAQIQIEIENGNYPH